DDHGYADAGCYGNDVVRTPNLDRLAKESMRFTHAFAGSPTCTPSRSVIYTGLMPFRNGAHPNHSRIRPGIKTLPHYLAALGYRVVLAGKTHVGPRAAFPFEYLPAQLKGHRAASVPRVYGNDLDTDVVDQLLADHRTTRKEQPLCLIIAAWSPHVVWRWKEYDSAKVTVPPYMIDTALTRHAVARYYTDVTLMDKRLGDCLESVKKHGLQDNTLFIYTSDQGAQWPHAKWNLYDAGIRVPLLARWPGKVKAGSVSDAIVSLVDVLPTFIEVAGGEPPREMDGCSFLPVLLGKGTRHRRVIFATHTGDGKMNDFPMRCIRTSTHKYILNLKPQNLYTTHITDGKDRDGRDYWQTWLEKAKTDEHAGRIVRDYQHRPAEELYDLRADPYELSNIAADPANRDLAKFLGKRLENWMEKQSDPGAATQMRAQTNEKNANK
ncbi:sulfatase, partial [bacterium]|nr:sulfatase [bacterium]